MASGEIEVTVNVESQIHKILHELVNTLYTEHDIRLAHIDIDWTVRRLVGGDPVWSVETISVETKSP